MTSLQAHIVSAAGTRGDKRATRLEDVQLALVHVAEGGARPSWDPTPLSNRVYRRQSVSWSDRRSIRRRVNRTSKDDELVHQDRMRL